jgi:hypothetical protein
MPALACALVLPSVLAIATGGHVVQAKVPKRGVEISLEIADFKPEKPDQERTLLIGPMHGDAMVSVLWEDNFPYIATSECGKKYEREAAYKSFTVDGIACCQFELNMHDVMVQTTWHAWPTTPDLLFDIHASVTGLKKDAHSASTFSKDDFVRLVKTWRVSGKVDRGSLRLPPEVYAFRDEAAKAGGDQLAWVTKQCDARADDWAVHFYFGALGYQVKKIEVVAQGYSRAADLLSNAGDRTPKQTRAMVEALDGAAFALAMQKKFTEAIPVCSRLVDAVKPNDVEDLRKLREQALYNLACCHAMTEQPDKAIDYLRQAISARPAYKKSAATDEMLAPLRKKPEFKSLVGA